MTLKLQNQTILITGASMGIGEKTTQLFAAQGANLILVARSEAKLKELQARLEQPGQLIKYLVCDLSQASQVEALLEKLKAEPKLDGILHNAGIGLYGNFETYSEEVIRRVFEVNFFSILKLTQGLLPLLQKSARPRLAFVSSILGWRAVPRLSIYAASKYALNGFVEALRLELVTAGIQVINIYPGRTKTGFTQNAPSTGWRPFATDQGGVAPEYVARKILKAYLRAKRDEYVVWGNRFLLWANFYLPRVLDWGIRKLYKYVYRGPA